MASLLLTLRDILLLRRGPQDMPHSTQLLIAAAALCVIVQLVFAAIHDASLGEVLLGAALWLAFTLGMLRLMLRVRGLDNRFVQTALTLLCCTLVFTLISMPVALLVGEPPATPEQMTGLQLLLGVVSLPLLLWKIAVDAHVFRHSLDVPFMTGIVIAVLWIVAALALGGIAGAPAAGT